MQWDDLKYLVALVRAGTLSGAARDMGTEHTTIARRIASLERKLGIKLFDRSSKGFVLTPEGEPILELATRIERKVFDIERLAQGRQASLTGTVRISAPPTLASGFLAQKFLTLREQHPALELELVGDARSASLSRREADIAIRLNRAATPSVFVRRVGALGFGLYGQREYIEGTCDRRRDFLGYDDSLEHVPQQRWLRSVCGERKLVFRSNDLHTLHSAAAAGLGLAVLPRYLGDPDERLQRVVVDPAPENRDLWLLIHPDLRGSPRFRAVFDHMVSMVETNGELLNPPA